MLAKIKIMIENLNMQKSTSPTLIHLNTPHFCKSERNKAFSNQLFQKYLSTQVFCDLDIDFYISLAIFLFILICHLHSLKEDVQKLKVCGVNPVMGLMIYFFVGYFLCIKMPHNKCVALCIYVSIYLSLSVLKMF